MEIVHYTSGLGQTPTIKYLNSLPDEMHTRKIWEVINRLERFELRKFLNSTDIKKIKRSKKNIWELKIRCQNNASYRALFGIREDKIIILNIFIKKERKIRKKEINIAISRLI